MKLTLTVEINDQELDAAASNPGSMRTLQRKIGGLFASTAEQSIETRLTIAHDKGVKPSSPFSMQPGGWKVEGDA